MLLREPPVRVVRECREHAAVVHVVAEHESERAVDSPPRAAGVEVGASVGVPAAVDVVVEVEGRIVGARLYHRIVNISPRDAHPRHDVGVHRQPEFPVDRRGAIGCRIASRSICRDRRGVYICRPVMDAEEPQPQRRSTDQRCHRHHDCKSLLDICAHLNLQEDGRGGSSPPRPLRSTGTRLLLGTLVSGSLAN